MNKIDTMSVNAIQIVLSAEPAIQKEQKSGHPGLPLGDPPMAYELWTRHMNHNPARSTVAKPRPFPSYPADTGSIPVILFASICFGHGDLKKEDLMEFRQLGSLTTRSSGVPSHRRR